MCKKEFPRFSIISSFLPPEHAGSGLNAYNFARHLSQENYNVTLLTFNRNLQLKSFEKNNNCQLIRIPYFNQNLLLKLLSSPIIVLYYLFVIPKNDVIIIYGNKIFLYECIIIISSVFKKKIVFQSLLIEIDDLKTILSSPRILNFFYKWLFSKVSLYHSINKEFTKKYNETFGNNANILEIPQGVDTGIFTPVEPDQKKAKRQKHNLPDGLILISIGFLINRKDYRNIIDSLNLLEIPFHYMILGDFNFDKNHFLRKFQPEANELYDYAISRLGNKVIFTGNVIEVQEYLQCADIFIHGAKQEGLPNVILEAMAVGLPVFSKEIPGLTNFILLNGYNCFIYKNNSELLSLILMILKDDALFNSISKNARIFIRENCCFDVLTMNLLRKLYPDHEY